MSREGLSQYFPEIWIITIVLGAVIFLVYGIIRMSFINNRLPRMSLDERIKYLHPFLDIEENEEEEKEGEEEGQEEDSGD